MQVVKEIGAETDGVELICTALLKMSGAQVLRVVESGYLVSGCSVMSFLCRPGSEADRALDTYTFTQMMHGISDQSGAGDGGITNQAEAAADEGSVSGDRLAGRSHKACQKQVCHACLCGDGVHASEPGHEELCERVLEAGGMQAVVNILTEDGPHQEETEVAKHCLGAVDAMMGVCSRCWLFDACTDAPSCMGARAVAEFTRLGGVGAVLKAYERNCAARRELGKDAEDTECDVVKILLRMCQVAPCMCGPQIVGAGGVHVLLSVAAPRENDGRARDTVRCVRWSSIGIGVYVCKRGSGQWTILLMCLCEPCWYWCL